MKEGWEYRKLGEVAEVIHGKNQKDVLSEEGQYPIYGSGGNIMGYANDYLCEAGTTILGRKGSINNPQFIEERFWNVDTAFGISAKEGYDSKFVYYFITSINWLEKNTGTTLPSLTQQVVKSVELPVPPLSEQQSIVEYLDSAFAKIDSMKANAEKALNEAKALFQASLKEMLEPKEEWEEKTLGEVCIKSKNIRWEEYQDGKIFTYIDLTSVNRETLSIVEPQFIEKNNAPSRAKQIVKTGDIIFATTRPTLRRVCLISEDFDSQICSTGFCVLRPKQEITSKWIFFSLLNEDFYQYIEPLQTGASYPAVTDGIVKNYRISYPSSITYQQTIVDTLDSLKSKVDKLQENYDKISQECDALKQAILRQVFE